MTLEAVLSASSVGTLQAYRLQHNIFKPLVLGMTLTALFPALPALYNFLQISIQGNKYINEILLHSKAKPSASLISSASLLSAPAGVGACQQEYTTKEE